MIKVIKKKDGSVFRVKYDSVDHNLVSSMILRISYKGCNLFYAQGYFKGTSSKNTLLLHRVIIGAKPGQIVDHIDGNPLNNSRENLRICSLSENLANKRKKRGCLSKFKGVDYVKKDKVWRSRLYFEKKLLHIKYFQSEIEAAKSYDEAAIKYGNGFFKLNFKSSIHIYGK